MVGLNSAKLNRPLSPSDHIGWKQKILPGMSQAKEHQAKTTDLFSWDVTKVYDISDIILL
jgi:hypothetical protein